MFGILGALIASAIIGGLATLGTSAIENGVNYANQKAANEQNKALQDAANAANIQMNQETNETNLQIARETNQMQIDLANSAHQREVADLKAAGLNPILAAGGQGAPMTALNVGTAQAGKVDAAKVGAPQIDLAGVSSAMTSIANLMLLSKVLGPTTNIKKVYGSINSAGRIGSLLRIK